MKLTVRAAGWQALGFLCVGVLGGAGCGDDRASPSYRPGLDFDAGAGPQDAGPDRSDGTTGDGGLPPPMTAPGGRRIISGAVKFISKGSPCSFDSDPKAEVWCAILRPSVLQLGSSALFVVNISKAMAGTAVACGTAAGDPNCLMLTGGFEEDDTHKAAFQGSTLVYYDLTGAPYAWRPGMLNGRRLVTISSDTGNTHDCVAAPRGDAVACLQDVPAVILPTGGAPGAGASATATFSDLLVGHAGATAPLLEKIETVVSGDTNDSLPRSSFHFVGPMADRIAWSTPVQPGGAEVLKVQVVGDEASRQVVATDVSRWVTSPDFTQWGWLSAFNYDRSAPSGTLQAAPFPGGEAPITVRENTAAFSFVKNHGMSILDDTGGLFGMVDVASKAALVPLDSRVLGVIAVSGEGHLAYVKSFDFIFSLVDLFVQKYDGSGTGCSLDRNEEVPYGGLLGARFLPNSAALLWARVTNLDTTDDRLKAAGKFTRTADCVTQTVASDVVAQGTLGQDGISVSDSFDGASGTLSIRGLAGTGDMLAPEDAMLVQTRMDSSLSLYPLLHVLVYTVNIGESADGLYLRPVPSSTAPSP